MSDDEELWDKAERLTAIERVAFPGAQNMARLALKTRAERDDLRKLGRVIKKATDG